MKKYLNFEEYKEECKREKSDEEIILGIKEFFNFLKEYNPEITAHTMFYSILSSSFSLSDQMARIIKEYYGYERIENKLIFKKNHFTKYLK